MIIDKRFSKIRLNTLDLSEATGPFFAKMVLN